MQRAAPATHFWRPPPGPPPPIPGFLFSGRSSLAGTPESGAPRPLDRGNQLQLQGRMQTGLERIKALVSTNVWYCMDGWKGQTSFGRSSPWLMGCGRRR